MAVFWCCAWLCLLQRHPAALRRLHDRLCHPHRSCACHPLGGLVIPATIHRQSCVPFASVQTHGLDDNHPRTRPVFGFAIVALLLPFIGLNAAYPHDAFLLIWQGWAADSLPTRDLHDLQDHPTRNTRHVFWDAGRLANLSSAYPPLSGYLLDYLASPWDFAACFFLAGIFFALSWSAPRRRASRKTPKNNPRRKIPLLERCPKVLRRDKNFNWFLVVRAPLPIRHPGFRSTSSTPCANSTWTPSPQAFTAALRHLPDHCQYRHGAGWETNGHRAMLILGGVAAFLSALLAWGATSLAWFYPIFILTAWQTSRFGRSA